MIPNYQPPYKTISLYHQIIIFQHGTWISKDGSPIRYINWASRYQFPTKYTIFHKNRLVSRILSPGTRLERYYASQDGGRCSAALMAPDFTRVLLFPVDCSRNFTSRIVCVARSLHNKSLDYNDHSVELHYVGYQTQHKNKSILEISRQICPQGYNFGYRNVCLQLVQFSGFLSARSVGECATWNYEIMKTINYQL